MRKCKLPIHLIQQATSEGWSKPLAMWASMKCIFESSHVHDYSKLDITLIKSGISKPTYMKYLKVLDSKGLIYGKRGEKQMWLAGQKRILNEQLFPCNGKLRFVYLENNKNLRDSIERVALEANISAQSYEIEQDIRHNALQPKLQYEEIIKTVDGVKKLYYTLSSRETSLSCKSIAGLMGYKSSATGYKRQRKWKQQGFIESYRRTKVLGRISEETERNMRGLGKVLVRAQTGWFYQILANQIVVREQRFGMKKYECA
jgi:hypothetical protein